MSGVRHGLGKTLAGAEAARSLGRALVDVAVAALAAPFRRLSPRVSEFIITACALWALVCPLLLWISWSRAGFLILIGSTVIAVAIIYLLILLHPDDPF